MDFWSKYIERLSFLNPQLKIDHPLYRYRRYNQYLIDEITNDHMFLSTIEDLNDPFDSSFSISFDEALQETAMLEYYLVRCFFLYNEKWYPTVECNLKSQFDQIVTLEEFSELLAKEIIEVGGYIPASSIAKIIYRISSSRTSKRVVTGRVACFSETWESIPMWSYYAENHTGVCLKYDFSLLDTNNFSHQTVLESLQKVWYSQNRPIDTEGTYSPFVKGLQWAHEQEWRLFKNFGDPYISVPCLTEIYLGVNFNYENLAPIIDAAKALPREIKIFKLHVKPDTYGFEQIYINY